MMDTDAIYSAVCAYGAAKGARRVIDADYYIEAVMHLLDEADAERKELLATNERLVDEVAELKAELERIKVMPPVAEVRLKMTGGNVGLSTHIVQLVEGYFPVGTKLYTLEGKT